MGYPLHTILTVRRLQRKGVISQVRFTGNDVFFNYGTGVGLRARCFPHSDLHVLQQILDQHEYGMAIDWMRSQQLDQDPLRIIDAGANVGYTSLFFLNAFPQASLVAVEPDPDNFKVLEYNLAHSGVRQPPRALSAALLSRSGIAVHINRQEGDKKDWSFSVQPTTAASDITSVCIADIVSQAAWDHIDILKIDIEGSETDVFSEQADLSYLAKTRLVLIEIHDQMADRALIQRLLVQKGFALQEHSETTFAINQAFI